MTESATVRAIFCRVCSAATGDMYQPGTDDISDRDICDNCRRYAVVPAASDGETVNRAESYERARNSGNRVVPTVEDEDGAEDMRPRCSGCGGMDFTITRRDVVTMERHWCGSEEDPEDSSICACDLEESEYDRTTDSIEIRCEHCGIDVTDTVEWHSD